MTLPGVTSSARDSMQSTAFRSSWTQPEGLVSAFVVEGKVVDVNLNLWTVDVVSQHDQRWYLNVQVGSPYLHSNNGEGIYAMPEIGAKLHVCIPSDGPPPFVLDFIMPQESIPQAGTPEEPEGVDGGISDVTFAGGRPRPKPGDIYIKGRDGNFVILHRGGVLQVGSTELAQRIYIPLQNLITDISQNYRHYNAGGSLNWFLAAGESETNPSTLHKQTYRLLAGDEKATIRITHGPLKDFVPEPLNGAQSEIEQLGMASKENPIIVEVVIAPDTIGADNGSIDADTPKATKLRYFFDKAGNVFMRSEASVLLFTRKRLRIVAKENIDVSTEKSFTLVAEETGRINGGNLLELQGKIVKINGGNSLVAHLGSTVEVRVLVPLEVLGAVPAVVGVPVIVAPLTTLGTPQTLRGTITSGKSNILV